VGLVAFALGFVLGVAEDAADLAEVAVGGVGGGGPGAQQAVVVQQGQV
jgi:hypothetical protein